MESELVLFHLGSIDDEFSSNKVEVSTFSLFDEILSLFSNSTSANRNSGKNNFEEGNISNISLFEELFPTSSPIQSPRQASTRSPIINIQNTLSTFSSKTGSNFLTIEQDSSTIFTSIVSGIMKKMEDEPENTTPQNIEITNFMVILDDTATTPTVSNTVENLSLKENETFSDLLFSNIASGESSSKTVSNGIHIERAITLLENFKTDPENVGNVTDSENSSDTSLPRIGRSQKVEIRQNKLDLDQQLLSSDLLNFVNFTESKLFKKKNGRILIKEIPSGISHTNNTKRK